MITADDVIDMTCLTRDEIDAIAEHEHVPEMTAALIGNYQMHLRHGAAHVHNMIAEDIRDALHRDDVAHAKELYTTLHHFLKTHPQGARDAAG